MQCQAEISQQRLQMKIGSIQELLIDQINAEHVLARSRADAPEIDGLVYMKPYPQAEVGTHVKAKITQADNYDLFAEPIL